MLFKLPQGSLDGICNYVVLKLITVNADYLSFSSHASCAASRNRGNEADIVLSATAFIGDPMGVIYSTAGSCCTADKETSPDDSPVLTFDPIRTV